MPLWIFTVGRLIFERGDLKIPYHNIATYVYGLIIPVIIGLVIQRKWPRIGKFLVRILKSCSAILIIFIVVFAIVTNLYLFKLFTWQVSLEQYLLHPWELCLSLKFHAWNYLCVLQVDFTRRNAVAIYWILRWVACSNPVQTKLSGPFSDSRWSWHTEHRHRHLRSTTDIGTTRSWLNHNRASRRCHYDTLPIDGILSVL